MRIFIPLVFICSLFSCKTEDITPNLNLLPKKQTYSSKKEQYVLTNLLPRGEFNSQNDIKVSMLQEGTTQDKEGNNIEIDIHNQINIVFEDYSSIQNLNDKAHYTKVVYLKWMGETTPPNLRSIDYHISQGENKNLYILPNWGGGFHSDNENTNTIYLHVLAEPISDETNTKTKLTMSIYENGVLTHLNSHE